MDSLFPDPYFLLTAYYYNQDDLFARDSLLEVIESKFTSLSPRLSSTNEYYMAHARGDLVKAHALFLEELRYDPTDEQTDGLTYGTTYASADARSDGPIHALTCALGGAPGATPVPYSHRARGRNPVLLLLLWPSSQPVRIIW